MLSTIKKNSKGFTIIEVLIVLAIAGLIMLVVFLAVPALQRNQRNSSRRSDVSKALGAASEISASKNGALIVAGDVAAIQTAANLNAGTTITTTIGTTVATVTKSPQDQIQFVTGVQCTNTHATNDYATLTAADYQAEVSLSSTRSLVAIFLVESAGGKFTTQCQGS